MADEPRHDVTGRLQRPTSFRPTKVTYGLSLLNLLSFALAVISASLVGPTGGGSIFGIPIGLFYVVVGLVVILSAGLCAIVGAIFLWRAEAPSRTAQRDEVSLGSPLLRDPHDSSAGPSSSHSGEGDSNNVDTQVSSSLADGLAGMDLGRAKQLAQLDHKMTVRRRVIFVAAYVTVTALSFGLGIEAVDLRSAGKGPVGVEIACIAITIASLQAAFFLTKRLVTQGMAISETKLDLRAVHVHSLHFAVDAFDHSCDICGEEINEGECFRCRLCDFDYCLDCFKKGQKLQDWGLLRGDTGVKVPQRVRQASMFTFFCRALSLLAAYRLHVFGTAACLLFNVTCRLLVPNLEGGLFDDLINKNGDRFLTRIKFLVLYWVGQTIFQSTQRLVARLMSRQLRLDLRMRLFRRLLSQDIAFFDATRAGAMAQRVEGDVEDMSRPVPILINSVLQSAVLIIGAVICCLVSSARLTVLSAACLFPMAYLTRVSAEWGSGLSNQMTACEEEGNSIVTESMSNIRHVRAFSAEEYEAGRYKRVLSRLFRKMHKEAVGDMLIENMYGSLEFLVEMLVLLFGGLAIVQGHAEALTVGQLVAFTMYWDILREGVDTIQDMFSELAQASGAAQRVFDLLDIEPDIPLEDGKKLDRRNFHGRISFIEVSFHYQGRPEKKVCNCLNLDVPAGGTCALVGRSGAGKSTLMHLLLRFYDPRSGEIRVDDFPLRNLNLRSFHDLIGFVSQDTKLHFGSIRDNLTYGLPLPREASNAEVEAAARKANCAEFVEEMEEKYDSKVGEGGVRLSGGQRQRLAIARAFLRDPRLLILDEATSHLDAENEQLVQAAIDELISGAQGPRLLIPDAATSLLDTENEQLVQAAIDDLGSGAQEPSLEQISSSGSCTVILIAHRLSTVRKADVIAVLDDGQVAESGTHEELKKKEIQAIHTFKGEMGIVCDMSGKVQEVSAGEPAHTKGVQKGDRILNIRGKKYSKASQANAEKSGLDFEVITVRDGIYSRLVAKQEERDANLLPEGGADELFHEVLGKKTPFERSGTGSRSGSDSSGGSSESSDSSQGSPPQKMQAAKPPTIAQKYVKKNIQDGISQEDGAGDGVRTEKEASGEGSDQDETERPRNARRKRPPAKAKTWPKLKNAKAKVRKRTAAAKSSSDTDSGDSPD